MDIVKMNVPTSAAIKPIIVNASRIIRVQKINFSAAWVALPLCFTAGIISGSGTG